MDERERRLAENEALFREINERVNLAAGAFTPDAHVYEFLCECANRDCTTPIELTRAQYDEIRGNPRRFALAVGHELPDVESVVGRFGEVLVVEKGGEAGRLVEKVDPRRRRR